MNAYCCMHDHMMLEASIGFNNPISYAPNKIIQHQVHFYQVILRINPNSKKYYNCILEKMML